MYFWTTSVSINATIFQSFCYEKSCGKKFKYARNPLTASILMQKTSVKMYSCKNWNFINRGPWFSFLVSSLSSMCDFLFFKLKVYTFSFDDRAMSAMHKSRTTIKPRFERSRVCRCEYVSTRVTRTRILSGVRGHKASPTVLHRSLLFLRLWLERLWDTFPDPATSLSDRIERFEAKRKKKLTH